jgi:hypothetical protein
MSTHPFKEHLSELTPGATRLTAEWSSDGGDLELPLELRKAIPSYHDGSRDYSVWLSMIVPAIEPAWDIPVSIPIIYCLTEMGQ